MLRAPGEGAWLPLLEKTCCCEEFNVGAWTERSGSPEQDAEFFPEEVLSDLGWTY